eukprot:1486707-Alexandrium_andersonii.AAC.1
MPQACLSVSLWLESWARQLLVGRRQNVQGQARKHCNQLAAVPSGRDASCTSSTRVATNNSTTM